MAKKSRATFQKQAKEKARQQKQQEKAQRRLASKEQCIPDEAPGVAGMGREPQVLSEQWDDAKPTD